MLLATAWLAPPLARGILEWTGDWWRDAASHPAGAAAVPDGFGRALQNLRWPVAATLALWLTAIWLVTLLASMLQTGGRPVRRPLSEAGILRPGSGLRSLLSTHQLWNVTAQGLTIGLLLACGVWFCFGRRLDLLLQSDAVHPAALMRDLLQLTCRAGGWIAVVMLFSSLLDWTVQRRLWYRRQRMTDQEVREEARQDSSPRLRNGRALSGTSAIDGVGGVNTGS